MRIGLIGERGVQGESSAVKPESRVDSESSREAAVKKVSHRAFLKSLVGVVGLVGLAQVAEKPQTALAAGGNATVEGTLEVTSKVGIGKSDPETALHIGSGSIKIGTRVIADDNGCYYS